MQDGEFTEDALVVHSHGRASWTFYREGFGGIGD